MGIVKKSMIVAAIIGVGFGVYQIHKHFSKSENESATSVDDVNDEMEEN